MKINKRLKTISKLIDNNSVILDVGCDHALLDIYTVLNNNSIKAYASDNKKGPLEGAKANISKYRLNDKINTILMDGIEAVPEDVNTVVISGMGGMNIINILSNKDSLKNVDTLILSPNNDYINVRKKIVKLGYYFEDEVLLIDKGITYLIMKLKKGKKRYCKREMVLGPILLQKNDKVFIKYLDDELKRKKIIYSLTPKKYFYRRLKLKKDMRLIQGR